MIALDIRETLEPTATQGGSTSSYVVSTFLKPVSKSAPLRSNAFRQEAGYNLGALLDNAMANQSSKTLVVSLSNTAILKDRRSVAKGMTEADLSRATSVWARREKLGRDDETRSHTAQHGGGSEYITYAVRGSLLKQIRDAAKRHGLVLARITDHAYGWAKALPDDTHLVLDTSDAKAEIVRAYLFTKPIAAERTLRLDKDLENTLEAAITENQRARYFDGLVSKISCVGGNGLPFERILNLPIEPLATDLPAELHRYIGLLGLAGYEA